MNTLRALLLATLCLFGVVATSAARDDLIAVHSFADTSCGTWVGSQHNLAERAQYLYWFRGFVTGYNFGQPSNQVSLEVMPDHATLALVVAGGAVRVREEGRRSTGSEAGEEKTL